MHEKFICHRDLKPENILYNETENVNEKQSLSKNEGTSNEVSKVKITQRI